jgi:hypothetical protein
VEREYVGIDLHRRPSVVIRQNAHGKLLSKVHIDNDPMALSAAVAAVGGSIGRRSSPSCLRLRARACGSG